MEDRTGPDPQTTQVRKSPPRSDSTRRPSRWCSEADRPPGPPDRAPTPAATPPERTFCCSVLLEDGWSTSHPRGPSSEAPQRPTRPPLNPPSGGGGRGTVEACQPRHHLSLERVVVCSRARPKLCPGPEGHRSTECSVGGGRGPSTGGPFDPPPQSLRLLEGDHRSSEQPSEPLIETNIFGDLRYPSPQKDVRC